MRELEDETYSCNGCAGEVSVIDAMWITSDGKHPRWSDPADPYCCAECFAYHRSVDEREEIASGLERLASSVPAASEMLRRASRMVRDRAKEPTDG